MRFQRYTCDFCRSLLPFDSSRSRAKLFIIWREDAKYGMERRVAFAYLCMSISELVLQDGFSVTEELHFIGQEVESFSQCLGELFRVSLNMWHVASHQI